MPASQSERNLKWRTKNPEKHKACYDNWRVENKEKRNAYARKWHAEKRAADPSGCAEKARKHALKRRYGITPECYDAMLLKQGGRCALCDRTEADDRYNRLHVDHCHKTGEVRGLLCGKHNTALGTFGDNEAGLLRAIQYLKNGGGV